MSRSIVTTLTIALLSTWAWAAEPGSSATIELRESVQVGGDLITLGQLAKITPEEQTEQLGAIEVGPAPLPGDNRCLTRGYLKMRLRRGGVDCASVTFSGAETVEVRRAPMPTATQRQAPGEVEAADPPGARPSVPEPIVVERGTRVRLSVVCGAVCVGAEATLMEDAVVGGRAKMRVEQTRETVVAQIVQPEEAVIRRE